ncbi:MAG TPA: hypothetical protein VF775_04875 [Geobacteraceae bacterium]
MKAKSSYSNFKKTNYVNVVLGFTGVMAFAASLTISWPALTHIGARII